MSGTCLCEYYQSEIITAPAFFEPNSLLSEFLFIFKNDFFRAFIRDFRRFKTENE